MKKQTKLILSLLIIVVSIIIAVVFLTQETSNVVSTETKSADKNLLVGNWVRTDAGYRILISQVNEEGLLNAQYFNPNPIIVGKANWVESYGNLKIIIELRDVNYPGSTYTLNYIPDRDMLAGEYFQAVEGLTFYVEFTRSK